MNFRIFCWLLNKYYSSFNLKISSNTSKSSINIINNMNIINYIFNLSNINLLIYKKNEKVDFNPSFISTFTFIVSIDTFLREVSLRRIK